MGIAPNQHPEFTESLRRAHALLRTGRAASAEAALRALEARYPGEVNCLWLLGVALRDQDKFSASIETLERALAAAANFHTARVDLARAYRRTGRAEEARAEVRRVLEAMPHHHGAWLAYGDVLVDLRKYHDATVAFDRARLTDPHRARI
ncbi:MAG: tetratricopeptide repeat protein, partial [Steroidobacteraceae bacterium]